MFVALLSLCLCRAPVPTHLMREVPDPIRPGFRWWFQGYELQVTAADGEWLSYRNLSNPAVGWGDNRQTKAATRAEVRQYGVPPEPPGNTYWFDP